MAKQSTLTREQWLAQMAQKFFPILAQAGCDMTNVKFRVSCGLPHGRAFGAKRTTGQCWDVTASADKTHEIFISPTISSAFEVSHTLLHELIHAGVGVKEGHKGRFKKVALAVGLTGKMKETVPGDSLKALLIGFIDQVGEYPHAAMDYSKRKKQTTRMIKMECPCCGYVARTSLKWIDDLGATLCPSGTRMLVEGEADESEG